MLMERPLEHLFPIAQSILIASLDSNAKLACALIKAECVRSTEQFRFASVPKDRTRAIFILVAPSVTVTISLSATNTGLVTTEWSGRDTSSSIQWVRVTLTLGLMTRQCVPFQATREDHQDTPGAKTSLERVLWTRMAMSLIVPVHAL